ncbi:hypothetical protein N7520_004788 [Penicillium odoratum]|uniref:uncharacterized protein n=1 Tax=Penicillium odoratum TaxID=1167516 RepID=UPI002547ABC9|nr:uncharacterized protein N7520_004788 [Penicillium odoratum]KAJ5765229.1 hypothetical protein N7520_004788 [Penicillium odoratum]
MSRTIPFQSWMSLGTGYQSLPELPALQNAVDITVTEGKPGQRVIFEHFICRSMSQLATALDISALLAINIKLSGASVLGAGDFIKNREVRKEPVETFLEQFERIIAAD